MRRGMIAVPALLLAIGLLAGLAATAKLYGALQERQTVFRYIDEALALPPEALHRVSWEPPLRPLVREVNDTDRDMLGRRLGDAWTAFALAQDTDETAMLADWFGGTALTRAQTAAAAAHENGSRMVVLRMAAAPGFYHLDGSVLQLATRALTVRYATDEDGIALFELGEDENITTLVNRSTGWHIATHERHGWTPAAEPQGVRPVPPLLAGLNYYPSATPWRKFWRSYDPRTTAADLDLMAGLAANSVRIFLPREDFLPGTAGLEARLGHLADFLSQAEARGLSVVPTLFDLKGSYATATWLQDVGYLDAVMPVLSASPAVVLIDLKNEPDLDFATQGRGHVLAWLRSMAAVIRTAAPNLPLTVGWSHADAAQELWDVLDALSYHDYAPIEGAEARLADVRAGAAGKPVLVTEIGVTSWNVMQGWPSSDAAQTSALSGRLSALAAADGVFIWTLHDFPDPDATAIGTSIWVRGLQSNYGLYDLAGQRKPAADVVANAFRNLSRGPSR